MVVELLLLVDKKKNETADGRFDDNVDRVRAFCIVSQLRTEEDYGVVVSSSQSKEGWMNVANTE